jgi:hypothetical protein
MCVKDALETAGFSVTAVPRTLPAGISATEYTCALDGQEFTLTQSPLPDRADYRYLLGLSKRAASDALIRARDVLAKHGARDSLP